MTVCSFREFAFRRAAEACAAAAGLVAFLVLLCWTFGMERVTALGRDYVPMYFLTATLMLLLSCSVVFLRCWPSRPAAGGFALMAIVVVEVASLLVGAQILLGFDLSLLRWLCPQRVAGEIFRSMRCHPCRRRRLSVPVWPCWVNCRLGVAAGGPGKRPRFWPWRRGR